MTSPAAEPHSPGQRETFRCAGLCLAWLVAAAATAAWIALRARAGSFALQVGAPLLCAYACLAFVVEAMGLDVAAAGVGVPVRLSAAPDLPVWRTRLELGQIYNVLSLPKWAGIERARIQTASGERYTLLFARRAARLAFFRTIRELLRPEIDIYRET